MMELGEAPYKKIPSSSSSSSSSSSWSSQLKIRTRNMISLSSLVSVSVLLVLASYVQRTAAGWVDPDTPEKYQSMISLEDGRKYELVMSDEFNVEGRSFHDGDDPTWTAVTRSDDSMTDTGLGSQMYYNSSYAQTNDGMLNISTTTDKTTWRGFNPYKKKYEQLEKDFRSSMVSTWNKFCFTGGIIELSCKLPGHHDIAGLWPAFWLLGNLGRASYEGSTNLMWPWSYNQCDRKRQRAQELSACNGVKHFGMHKHQGRGSTEIDIFEAMAGKASIGDQDDPRKTVQIPYASTTLQIAPGLPDHRPANGDLLDRNNKKITWYDGMRYGPNSTQNWHFYGLSVDKTSAVEPVYRTAAQAYLADALSGITSLQETHYKHQHKWKLEWQPGRGGHLIWYLDDVLLFSVNDTTLEELMGTMIPEEPSYVILNTAVSTSWGFPIPCPPGCACDCWDCNDSKCKCALPPGFCAMLPQSFMIDYVRVYQDPNDKRQTVGCDTPTHPTKRFIKAHEGRYIYKNAKHSLKKVHAGGGECEKTADCYNGVCMSTKKCQCLDGYTGPRCQVPHYHDDYVISHGEEIFEPLPMSVPVTLAALAAAMFVVIVSASFIVGQGIRKSKRAYREELRNSNWRSYD